MGGPKKGSRTREGQLARDLIKKSERSPKVVKIGAMPEEGARTGALGPNAFKLRQEISAQRKKVELLRERNPKKAEEAEKRLIELTERFARMRKE